MLKMNITFKTIQINKKSEIRPFSKITTHLEYDYSRINQSFITKSSKTQINIYKEYNSKILKKLWFRKFQKEPIVFIDYFDRST